MATVSIHVLNEEPQAGYDSYDVFGQSQLQVSAAEGLLANDYDHDGDPLMVEPGL